MPSHFESTIVARMLRTLGRSRLYRFRFLLLSLLGHISFVLVFGFFHQSSTDIADLDLDWIELAEIEFAGDEESSVDSKVRKSKTPSKLASKSDQILMKQNFKKQPSLALKAMTSIESALESVRTIRVPPNGSALSGGAALDSGQSVNPFERGIYTAGEGIVAVRNKHVRLYRYIYSRIEDALFYPSELRARSITGEVRGILFFDQQGRYQRQLSQFESGSPFLRVYVVRLVDHLFATLDLPKGINSQEGEEFSVNLLFRFEQKEADMAHLNGEAKVLLANNMQFYRAFTKSSLAWQAGPFSGVFPAPSVGLDMTWFYRKGKEALSEKAKARANMDPLERYRNDPNFHGN